MTTDIFEALDSAGFGSNVCEIASQGDYRVLRLEDKTGEGFMTMYRLFDGVYLMYNDFHLQSCTSHYQNAETVLCIDRCREGRIEHENALQEHYYMEAGNIRIDKRVHHRHRRTDNNSYLYLHSQLEARTHRAVYAQLHIKKPQTFYRLSENFFAFSKKFFKTP